MAKTKNGRQPSAQAGAAPQGTNQQPASTATSPATSDQAPAQDSGTTDQAKTEAKTQDEASASGKTSTQSGLRIRSKTAGFRRAGRKWPAEPVEVLASEFSDEQIAMLREERELIVEDIEIEVAK